MDKTRKLPSFFVIGAQKSGTTTLHDRLRAEAGISLPGCKETHFFSLDDIYGRGLEWYYSQFDQSKQVRDNLIGEVDPDYIFYKDTPERIRTMIGKPRFVLLLRNPIDRAYSHYLMSLRRCIETLPFAEALKAEQERCGRQDREYLAHFSYMARGRYCSQIERYMMAFPGSEFLFVKYDELFSADAGQEAYDRICRHIGLASTPKAFDAGKRSNAASRPRIKFFSDFLHGRSPVKKAVGRLIPSREVKLKIAMFLERMNRSPVKAGKSGWRCSVPSRFFDAANTEILALERLTGLKLQDWVRKNSGAGK